MKKILTIFLAIVFLMPSLQLDDELFQSIDECGIVEEIEYDSFNYFNKEPSKKNMVIYLPYNYDSSKKYNVIFALPGTGADESYILGHDTLYYGDRVSIKNMLDNMIANELCEPFIFVCINCYQNITNRYEDLSVNSEQVGKELRDIIIPYLKDNYSVYDTKEHYGIIGFSYGSMLIFNAVISMDLDLIGNYGCVSGYVGYDDTITGDINYLYISCGDYDLYKDASYNGYNDLLNNENIKIKDGAFIINPRIGHDWSMFINGIYDCAQLWF